MVSSSSALKKHALRTPTQEHLRLVFADGAVKMESTHGGSGVKDPSYSAGKRKEYAAKGSESAQQNDMKWRPPDGAPNSELKVNTRGYRCSISSTPPRCSQFCCRENTRVLGALGAEKFLAGKNPR